jgi:tripartite-type tricarboxylate transporter receptor subunit TctC
MRDVSFRGKLTSVMVAGAAALLLAVSTPASAQSWTPEYSGDELQPLADGFPDRPITILNVDDPGSPDGIYARTLQKVLNDISPQRVNVLDRPSTAFGTWEALKFAEGEPGGDAGHVMVVHTVPGTALDLLTVDLKKEQGMDLSDLNIVLTTEEVPYVVISRKDAPWGASFDEMIAYAKTNPGKVRYLSREVGSAADITMTWLFDQKDVDVEKIIGGSMQEIGIAVAAGEVDVALVFAEVALTHFQNEKIEVLLLTGETAIAPWTDKPTLSQVVEAKDVLWGRVIGLAVPASVPDEHRAWLFELVRKGTEDARYTERGATVPGRVLKIRDHDDAVALATAIRDFGDPIVRELGLHFEGK